METNIADGLKAGIKSLSELFEKDNNVKWVDHQVGFCPSLELFQVAGKAFTIDRFVGKLQSYPYWLTLRNPLNRSDCKPSDFRWHKHTPPGVKANPKICIAVDDCPTSDLGIASNMC